jgi:hypothetical protein
MVVHTIILSTEPLRKEDCKFETSVSNLAKLFSKLCGEKKGWSSVLQ